MPGEQHRTGNGNKARAHATITVTPASQTLSSNASLNVTVSVGGTGATPTGTITLREAGSLPDRDHRNQPLHQRRQLRLYYSGQHAQQQLGRRSRHTDGCL